MHIGHAIHEELKRQQRTTTWLARQLYCDRTNVYHIYKSESINTNQLSRISAVLKHNFFEDLATEMRETLQE